MQHVGLREIPLDIQILMFHIPYNAEKRKCWSRRWEGLEAQTFDRERNQILGSSEPESNGLLAHRTQKQGMSRVDLDVIAGNHSLDYRGFLGHWTRKTQQGARTAQFFHVKDTKMAMSIYVLN